MAYSPTLLDAAAVLVALILFNRLFSKKRQGPLPPGPKGLPLIGNMLDMPASHEWRTFAQWGERWGEIFLRYCALMLSVCLTPSVPT